MPSLSVPEVSFPVFTVDAFTNERFKGNPACVCLVSEELSSDVMLDIGKELNQPVTAFIQVEDGEQESFDTAQKFKICWFSSKREITLCGHATLASAAVLFNAKGNTHESVTFKSRFGVELTVRRNTDEMLTMSLPLAKPQKQKAADWETLLEMIFEKRISYTELQIDGLKNLLVRLDDSVTREQLASMAVPTFGSDVIDAGRGLISGVILTTKGESDPYDFYSRYFPPWLGVDEDPVCGSAHTFLAVYWSRVLDKVKMKARQVSPRGGDLDLLLKDDENIVEISSPAVILTRGIMTV